jgi:23S rRNA (pseudouridine1915-N3)-methyltransferase
MDITILAVGKIKDRSYLQKIEEYAGRIRHDAKLEIVEIRDADPETEGAKIIEYCERNSAQVFALDEKGKFFTSVEFAREIAAVPRKIIMLIGGPFGLSEKAKRAANKLISLSPMTFPHELARLLLLEQLYRAVSIIKGRKYHK